MEHQKEALNLPRTGRSAYFASHSKYKIYKVETIEKSMALIEESKTDLLVSARLAGVSDLIAV